MEGRLNPGEMGTKGSFSSLRIGALFLEKVALFMLAFTVEERSMFGGGGGRDTCLYLGKTPRKGKKSLASALPLDTARGVLILLLHFWGPALPLLTLPSMR